MKANESQSASKSNSPGRVSFIDGRGELPMLEVPRQTAADYRAFRAWLRATPTVVAAADPVSARYAG